MKLLADDDQINLLVQTLPLVIKQQANKQLNKQKNMLFTSHNAENARSSNPHQASL